MKQHVNLIHCLPEERPESFLAKKIVALGVLFFIILLVYTSVMIWESNKLNRVFQVLSQRTMLLSAQLELFKKKNSDLIKGTLLLEQLTDFADSIEAKKQIVSILSSRKSVFNVDGFSQYFSVLSETTPANVWLTRIQVRQGGKTIVLLGKALKSSDVLAYMASLNETTTYKARPFRLSQLTHENNSSQVVGFSIISVLAESE